jgi:hypothetical protein
VSAAWYANLWEDEAWKGDKGVCCVVVLGQKFSVDFGRVLGRRSDTVNIWPSDPAFPEYSGALLEFCCCFARLELKPPIRIYAPFNHYLLSTQIGA